MLRASSSEDRTVARRERAKITRFRTPKSAAGGTGEGGGSSTENDLLAELLIRAEVIEQADIDQCTRFAISQRLHLGQMLIMHGCITTRDLQAAIDASAMIRYKLCDFDFAVNCLKIACESERSFADVHEERKRIP